MSLRTQVYIIILSNVGKPNSPKRTCVMHEEIVAKCGILFSGGCGRGGGNIIFLYNFP